MSLAHEKRVIYRKKPIFLKLAHTISFFDACGMNYLQLKYPSNIFRRLMRHAIGIELPDKCTDSVHGVTSPGLRQWRR